MFSLIGFNSHSNQNLFNVSQVQKIIVKQDSYLLAALEVINAFKKNPKQNLEMTVEFEGYTIDVKVSAEQELPNPKTYEDFVKHYRKQTKNRSNETPQIFCTRSPQALGPFNEVNGLYLFESALTDFFFAVERCPTNADPSNDKRIHKNQFRSDSNPLESRFDLTTQTGPKVAATIQDYTHPKASINSQSIVAEFSSAQPMRDSHSNKIEITIDEPCLTVLFRNVFD